MREHKVRQVWIDIDKDTQEITVTVDRFLVGVRHLYSVSPERMTQISRAVMADMLRGRCNVWPSLIGKTTWNAMYLRQ